LRSAVIEPTSQTTVLGDDDRLGLRDLRARPPRSLPLSLHD
jgi:hypothetical protein